MHPDCHRIAARQCAWRRQDAALRRCHVLLMATCTGVAQRWQQTCLWQVNHWTSVLGQSSGEGDGTHCRPIGVEHCLARGHTAAPLMYRRGVKG